MKLPEIAATRTVMAGLGATVALLVVIGALGAVTVDSSGSGAKKATPGHPVKASPISKNPLIVDACTLITAKDAAAALGADPGPSHLVLGSCLYDSGQRKLILALSHDNAKQQFDAARGKTAKAVGGLGDSAYIQDGRLRVLKGSTLMMVTLVPADPASADATLVALGRAAAARL